MGEALSTIIWIVVIVLFVVKRIQKQRKLAAEEALPPPRDDEQEERAAEGPPAGRLLGDLRQTLDGLLSEMGETPEPLPAKPAPPVTREVSRPPKPRESRLETMARVQRESSGQRPRALRIPETVRRTRYEPPLGRPVQPPVAPAPRAYERPGYYTRASRDIRNVRNGFVWSEILGKPLAMRDE
jgi:hypothetical protein